MNVPNQLTVGRLVVTMIFVAVLSFDFPYKYTVGLWLFVIASITDWLDGMIARKWNLITNFGKLMDPLADKVLVAAAFVMLSAEDVFPAWILVFILTREFLVTGLRLIATAQNVVLAADRLGKWKTIFQIITAIYLLLALASKEAPMSVFEGLFNIRGMGPHQLGLVLCFITLAATVVSGLNYVWTNRRLIEWDA